MIGDRAQRARVRVLLSLDPPSETTRYVDQLSLHMPDSVEVAYFSWTAALFGRHDVFHVHWPEFFLRADTSGKARVKRVLARLMLARLRRRGTTVIRTLHNPTPHEGISKQETSFVDALDALVATYIRLNPITAAPDHRPCRTILHGDYVERFTPLIEPRPRRTTGVVLTVGLIRPYKGILELVDAMDTALDDLSLRIVGKPVDAEIRAQVEAAAQGRPKVSMHFGFVSDRQLVEEILGSECVVLPYREIHNSGILLVVMSVGRPVLATRSETTEELQREVGDDWLQLFDGEISGSAMDNAVAHFRSTSRGAYPEFEGRDWRTVARQHAELYHGVSKRTAQQSVSFESATG